ncbi:MAG: recombination mediator RecR [Patescibacteria group bacterium]
MKFPISIQNLINHFSSLPTVGPKTAERYVFYLLKQNPEELQKFAQSIAELKEKTTICQTCLAVAETNPCAICTDNKRDNSLICVVASTQDMLTIEATKQFSGIYHILGGLINTIEGINPDKLYINKLVDKIKKNNIKELILALNPNLEGETTSLYLAKLLKNNNMIISRLAKGLPSGSNLEYADEMTLTSALKNRTDL